MTDENRGGYQPENPTPLTVEAWFSGDESCGLPGKCPAGGKFQWALNVDMTDSARTVEAWFSEDESYREYVHPNLVLYRSIATKEITGCRITMKPERPEPLHSALR